MEAVLCNRARVIIISAARNRDFSQVSAGQQRKRPKKSSLLHLFSVVCERPLTSASRTQVSRLWKRVLLFLHLEKMEFIVLQRHTNAHNCSCVSFRRRRVGPDWPSNTQRSTRISVIAGYIRTLIFSFGERGADKHNVHPLKEGDEGVEMAPSPPPPPRSRSLPSFHRTIIMFI